MLRTSVNYKTFPTHPHREYGSEVLQMSDDQGDLFDSVRTEQFIAGEIVRPIFQDGVETPEDPPLTPMPDHQDIGHFRYKSGTPMSFFPIPMGDMQVRQEFQRVYAVPALGMDSRRAYTGPNEMILPNKFSQ